MPATDSQVSMLRCAIALAWADGKLHQNERLLLITFFERNVHLSHAQRTQLKNDMYEKVGVDEVWKSISDKMDRAHLINVAPMIFWKDAVYCRDEKAVYEKIYTEHMASLTTKREMEQENEGVEELCQEWKDDEIAHLKNLSTAEKLIYYMENKVQMGKVPVSAKH